MASEFLASPGPETPEQAVARIRTKAGGADRISFVSGNFNIVHPGHLRLLRFAAETGDFLVVGLNPDGEPGTTLPAEMRLDAVRAIGLVNHALILPEPVDAFIGRLQPRFVVKGKEYENRSNIEAPIVAAYGGKLMFSSGETQFSSLNLLHREFRETNFSTVRKPLDFLKRHGFTLPELKDALARFAGIRVLVIGDLILDEYLTCDALGMSQEDPTIVVTPIDSKVFVGGAGIVAAHARGLGATVDYVSVVGADERAAYATTALDCFGVRTHLFADETRPTTLKQRFRAGGKTLLRVNHLRQHAIGKEILAEMAARIESLLDRTDLILFADFNYGCLPQALVDRVASAAKARGIPMGADSQASSQISDISRFRNMRIITPTEREARLALRDSDSGLVVLAERLQKAAEAENVIVTLGSEGILLHALDGGTHRTDRLPAFNTAPKDVAGAGDSFFTCASLALCAGENIWRACYLGSLAAACQVSRLGNTPLSTHDLINEIDVSSEWQGL